MTYNDISWYMLKSIKRTRLDRDSKTTSALLAFYPDYTYTDTEIRKIDKQAKTRLLQQKCITNSTSQKGYEITLWGRCRVLCHLFQIRFLCLCILCEAYTLHKHQMKNRCRLAYTIHAITDVFDGIYTKKTIQNSASILCYKGLACDITTQMICLKKDTIKKLDAYKEDIHKIHLWISGIPNMTEQMTIRDVVK